MRTIILKATERCNSNCVYCDVVRKKAPVTMTLDTLELFYRRVADYLAESPEESLNVIWHGGEPLLAGADFYRRAIDLHKTYCQGMGERLSYSMQSNLTLLDREFIDILKGFGIGVLGTSFDPIAGIRGPGQAVDSAAYNKAFFNGVMLLTQNGMDWGFIYVVHRKSLENPVSLLRQLLNLKPNGSIMLNPVLVYEDPGSEVAITPVEYAHFLGTMFGEWWQVRNRSPFLEPFASYLRNYSSNCLSLSCSSSGECGYSHLYLGPSGEASQCGRAGDWNYIEYRNLKDASLGELFQDPQRQRFSERTKLLQSAGPCQGCQYWKICHGGCALDSLAAYNDFNTRTPWCESTRIFLKEYFEPITGMSLG